MIEQLLSPVGLTLTYVWTFAVLASVQLTVRLIMAFSVRRTALGALAMTAVTVMVSLAYLVLFGQATGPLPLAMVVTGVAGYVVAVRLLGFRRKRSRYVAAVGIGLLCAPWGVFLVRSAG